MELIIMFVISSITGYAGFYFGKKQPKKPLTEEQEMKLKREKEEKQWQELFNYSERIAIKGYDNE